MPTTYPKFCARYELDPDTAEARDSYAEFWEALATLEAAVDRAEANNLEIRSKQDERDTRTRGR